MKFLQLLNGDLLNVEEIFSVYFERVDIGFKKEREIICSKIKTKNGDVFDFLDFPDFYGTQEEQLKFDSDEAVSLNLFALEFVLIMSDKTILKIEDVEEEAWKIFDRKYINQIKKLGE